MDSSANHGKWTTTIHLLSFSLLLSELNDAKAKTWQNAKPDGGVVQTIASSFHFYLAEK